MNKKRILETERLALIEYSIDLIEDIQKIYDDEDVIKFTLQGRKRTMEEVRTILRRTIINYHQSVPINRKWLIVLKETEAVIGYAGLIPLPDPEKGTELTYAVLEKFRGHGYATEISTALIDYSFSELKLKKLYALIEYGNPKSEEVVKRLGMSHQKDVSLRAYRFKLFSIMSSLPQ